jgi:G3E family GTPase
MESMPPDTQEKPPGLPVTVIGGYLGAGKTTLVNHLLRERGNKRIAVLVNDFGDISIDDDLIESADGNVMRLAGGCICCSFGSDMVAALIAMAVMEPRPDHILIETSGVALPGAVACTLQLLPALALDAVIVLADASTLRARASDRYVGDTVLQQLRDADLLVLNKTDLVDAATTAALASWLAEAAPTARLVYADHARVASAVVLAAGITPAEPQTGRESAMLRGPVPMTRPAPAPALFDSMSVEFSGAVDGALLVSLLADRQAGLVRAKGLVRDQDGSLCAIQLVGSRGTLAPSRHPRPETGRLICIGLKGQLNRPFVEAALRQAGVVASDAPSGAA